MTTEVKQRRAKVEEDTPTELAVEELDERLISGLSLSSSSSKYTSIAGRHDPFRAIFHSVRSHPARIRYLRNWLAHSTAKHDFEHFVLKTELLAQKTQEAKDLFEDAVAEARLDGIEEPPADETLLELLKLFEKAGDSLEGCKIEKYTTDDGDAVIHVSDDRKNYVVLEATHETGVTIHFNILSFVSYDSADEVSSEFLRTLAGSLKRNAAA